MKSAKCLVREDAAASMKLSAWRMTLRYCHVLTIFNYIVLSHYFHCTSSQCILGHLFSALAML